LVVFEDVVFSVFVFEGVFDEEDWVHFALVVEFLAVYFGDDFVMIHY